LFWNYQRRGRGLDKIKNTLMFIILISEFLFNVLPPLAYYFINLVCFLTRKCIIRLLVRRIGAHPYFWAVGFHIDKSGRNLHGPCIHRYLQTKKTPFSTV
jgi:hypothetical protein